METETKTVTKKPTKKPTTKPTKKPTKKATKKPTAKVKAATEKKVPTSGQSGPPGEYPFEVLNEKEQAVVEKLNGEGKGTREIIPIETLAMEVTFKTPPASAKQANSWVRNSLRRLWRGGWVEKPARGTYRVSTKGRNRLSKSE